MIGEEDIDEGLSLSSF